MIELVALNLTGLVGIIRYRNLVGHFGSVKEALQSGVRELQEVEGIGPITARAIVDVARSGAAEREMDRARRLGIHIVPFNRDDFPAPLKTIYDHPLVLAIRGEWRQSDALSIGVVGTRRATPYGLRQAKRFSVELASLGITVISGLARGIDTAAHEGALVPKGGRTVAVLGGGLNRIYPPENRALADRIAERGAVLSEFGIDQSPEPTFFPRRNRIISGLALGTLVVEADVKSGALITADWALEQSREVFCVPGSIENPGSRGCHLLIKQGAKLVEDLADILTELPAMAPVLEKLDRPVAISTLERSVLRVLEDRPLAIEWIAARTRLPESTVAAALESLVGKELAIRHEDGYLRARVQHKEMENVM